MFESLLEKIAGHPTFGPAVQQAAEDQWPFVLHYHHHGDTSSWCVAICTKMDSVIPLLGDPEELHELAHVKGLGSSEDQCLPLMATLGTELVERYGLAATPSIWKQGRPLREL